MVTGDFKTWVEYVQALPLEKAETEITAMLKQRVEAAIERAWKDFNKILIRVNAHKKQELKRHVLNFDEESGAIPLVEFVRYFAALEEEIKVNLEHGTEEVRDFAENLHDVMWNRLGNIKIDKRTIFAKD